MSARDVAAREAALAYHDSIGLGCGWRGYRKPCPCCDAFMAGWAGVHMPVFAGADNYLFAYDAGYDHFARRITGTQAKEAADAD